VACSPLKGVEREVALGNVASYWVDMPKAEAILALLAYEDAPFVEEVVAMFSGPINVDFESEQVWPIPRIPELVSAEASL
jgi:hypothetical protein